ncbi:alkaline phosphatase family protein [Vibrio sp. SS-MA-C1-2]|uniref:alkaline phosphatase family protein n=1 Tax=Vibrio sp. SS-MA-C1-2 TaxID=2908646 RepID=UPI001F2BE64F|nr:alkaline phosphatase family protein [Vibrio sp. SS-MA-C1-2]UJF18298.1 alkaline phosphatase family protein [Vibrio sp. SS-MA-C1-2]
MKKLPLIFCSSLLASSVFINVQAAETQPKLILQVTVDGLRADLIERYKHHFSDDGFKYLMDQGVYYTNANYEHANTETIVGHVSLATGAPPSVHGMVGNVWFDRKLDRLVYNVEDPNYHMLTSGAGVNSQTEVDPTQKIAKGDGRSPLPMLSSTFSDELSIATNGQSKIFSVSVKDRGAISLGGDNGKAFWFSKSKNQFVTSNYYYDAYPTWVETWNAQQYPDRYSDQQWQLSLPNKEYFNRNQSLADNDHIIDLAGFNKHFPHSFGHSSGKYFGTLLTLSPAGDELTSDFAKQLIKEEELGQDNVTDFLAVSFSSTDYIAHIFGPSTLEAEDNLVRLDKTLADLFNSVDKSIGLKNVLIVLSADHGTPEAAPVSHEIGDHDAHYFQKNALVTAQMAIRLKKEFGLSTDVIKLYSQPYIYLDHEILKKKKIAPEQIENLIAEELVKIYGVSSAVTRHQIESNQLPESRVGKLIIQNYHPQRSGDIHVIFSQRTYINDMDGLTIASTHGSPWRYDTHVPVIFAGLSLDSKMIDREITPYDISPTLSNFLGINQPSGATGNVLIEVTENKLD